MINFSHHRTPAESLQEYGRGLAGGLLFAMPLLFTMEVWWAGFILHPLRIVAYMVATFVILLSYNRFVGLRKDASFREVMIDSVEEMGIGILVAALVLWLSGRIAADMTFFEIGGKVIMEAMTVAIGVSVGTAQLGAPDEGDEGVAGDDGCNSKDYLSQTAVALCGAVLFAANIAPTDEITVVAMENSPERILLLCLFSLALGSLVIHFSEFRGAAAHVASETFSLKFRGIITTYSVALVASASSLFFFGKFDDQPFYIMVAQTAVLGVPAVLGASAGRLLLQTAKSSS